MTGSRYARGSIWERGSKSYLLVGPSALIEAAGIAQAIPLTDPAKAARVHHPLAVPIGRQVAHVYALQPIPADQLQPKDEVAGADELAQVDQALRDLLFS